MVFRRSSKTPAGRTKRKGTALKIGVALLVAGILAGCQADEFGYGPKHLRPVSDGVKRKMTSLNMSSTSPIMIRIFKEESTLEVWKKNRSGKYALLEDFEICKWSGELGPKFKEGDRQAPEGFYEITPALMNPNSSYHLSFNLGYPNKFDRAHGRTGSHLMVHGACSSRGCYAMTDRQVQDIYALARDSFKGGQRSFQVQAFPFRMTAENMAKHRKSPHLEYWQMLKTGYDHFEVTKTPPKVAVCEKKYVFDATTLVEGVPFRASAKCPDYQVNPRIASAVASKQNKDNEKFEQLVARFDAREERQQRWEERSTRFAEILGGDSAAEIETGAGAVSRPIDARPSQTAAASEETTAAPVPGQLAEESVETAYAAPESERSRVGSFFKRFVPFAGEEAEAASVGPISTEIVPVAKP